MKNKDAVGFNRAWRNAQDAHGKLARGYRLLSQNMCEVRKHAYRVAKWIKYMNEQHHNEFRDMVMTEGKKITEWIEERFAIIEAMGETRERLWEALDKGITERQYVQMGEVALVRKHVKTPRKIADLAEPAAPKEWATPTQKLAHERAVNEVLRTNNKIARQDVQELRRDLAVACKRVETLEKALKRTRKALDNMIEQAATGRKKKVG